MRRGVALAAALSLLGACARTPRTATAPPGMPGPRAAPDDRTCVQSERLVVIGGATGGAIASAGEARERIRTFCVVHGLDLAGFAELRAPQAMDAPAEWRGSPMRFGARYWNAVYVPRVDLDHAMPISVVDEHGRPQREGEGVPADGGYYFFVDAASGRVACKQASSRSPMPVAR